MNARTTAIAAIAISALLVFGNVSAMPDQTSPTPATADSAALYWQGHAALGSGDWSLALRRFADLEHHLRQSEPTVADAAIYWQAYALKRAGRTNETVATVKRLRREFPRSRWNDDAARLLRHDGGTADSNVRGGAQAASLLETLMSQPPAQAIPGLVALLQGRHPPQLKKRALFVLSQINDPGAVAQVVAVARGRDPSLRAEAVRLLGVIGAKDEFREVYAAARDTASKRQALNAMGVAGAVNALADVARSDTDLQTRRVAIKALGVASGYSPLLALYPKVIGSPELRDEVLRSLLIAADERVLLVLHRNARTSEEKQAVLRVLLEAGHNPNAEN